PAHPIRHELKPGKSSSRAVQNPGAPQSPENPPAGRSKIREHLRCKFAGNITIKGDRQTVSLGKRSTFARVSILSQEGKDVRIGSDCMFSRGIEVRTTDAHSLIDISSGKRINEAGHVTIGSHVWVGLSCVISKGVSIADDCVIGAMSFVNRSCHESGVVLAGSPAKIVRRGVTWSRKRKSIYTLDEMLSWHAKD
ncbi:acyltransferase, partial [Rhizobium halophilum]|uniref:acyltransferase n=1 Tax=Rhizobium halophilum TaxID=2846852 RepID=UPI001EFDB029